MFVSLRSAVLVLVAMPTLAAAQSQTDRFDLLCRSEAPGAAELRLSVFIYVNGAEVTHVDYSAPNEYRLQAYVNALTWSDGKSLYSADRFTGVLKITPGDYTFICEKRGGKKF